MKYLFCRQLLPEGVQWAVHVVVVGLGTHTQQVVVPAGPDGLVDAEVIAARTPSVPPYLVPSPIRGGRQVLAARLVKEMIRSMEYYVR